MYQPKTGSFLTQDPITDDESNLYRYVANNPVNDVDPSGLAPPRRRPIHQKLDREWWALVKKGVEKWRAADQVLYKYRHWPASAKAELHISDWQPDAWFDEKALAAAYQAYLVELATKVPSRVALVNVKSGKLLNFTFFARIPLKV